MNGLGPRAALRSIAEGFIATFYQMVSRMSDTQTSAKWEFDHWQCRHIPRGYKAILSVSLLYTGEGLEPPRRRAEDGLDSIAEQTADSHQDG